MAGFGCPGPSGFPLFLLRICWSCSSSCWGVVLLLELLGVGWELANAVLACIMVVMVASGVRNGELVSQGGMQVGMRTADGTEELCLTPRTGGAV